jgi:hypothetical protein
VTIAAGKDAITMADQFLTPGWYLLPGTWPYWIPNGLTAFPALRNDAWTQNPPSSDSKGGILGTLSEPTARLDRSKLGLGGILGALGASAESQASDIPYWLQTAMPFSAALEAPRPSSDARPQVASPPAWDSPALSNLSAPPSADFDWSAPYWLRTALPSGVNSELFGVPGPLAEQPANPAPQLWPAAARDVSIPSVPPALLPRFFSAPPNKDNVSLWQTPAGSNAEVLASPELDSVPPYDFPAAGLSPTPDYGRQLNDMLTNNGQPDRSAAPAGAEHVAFSDTWPVASSGSPANRQWMGGGIGAESNPRVISDVTPDDDWRPGARYTQSGQNRRPPSRGFRPIIIGEKLVEPEPGQAIRLDLAEARAKDAIARVRELGREGWLSAIGDQCSRKSRPDTKVQALGDHRVVYDGQ